MKCNKCGARLRQAEEKAIAEEKAAAQAPETVKEWCDQCMETQEKEHRGDIWEDFYNPDN